MSDLEHATSILLIIAKEGFLSSVFVILLPEPGTAP